MNRFVVLLRGVNVGGKNKLAMVELRECLENLGYSRVRTYIASGNVLLESDKDIGVIRTEIENALTKGFKFDSDLIKTLVLTHNQLHAIVTGKPPGFGEEPAMYHSDVIFLMDIAEDTALSVFKPREGVDMIWVGKGVIYSRRVSALRTKSRLNTIIGTPAYTSMTIRTWNTTVRLLALLES